MLPLLRMQSKDQSIKKKYRIPFPIIYFSQKNQNYDEGSIFIFNPFRFRAPHPNIII